MTVTALHLFLLRNLCQFLCYAHPPVDAALKTEWMSSVRFGFGEFWIPESDKKKTKKNVKREKKRLKIWTKKRSTSFLNAKRSNNNLKKKKAGEEG